MFSNLLCKELDAQFVVIDDATPRHESVENQELFYFRTVHDSISNKQVKICVEKKKITKSSRVLIGVDTLVGSEYLLAALSIVQEAGANFTEMFSICELEEFGARDAIEDHDDIELWSAFIFKQSGEVVFG